MDRPGETLATEAHPEQPPPAHIETQSIPELIYQALRRDIAGGVYKPGILRIRPLTERFGVSATPVREALRRLESEGLVTLRNRRIMIRELSRNELHEIFALRGELEALAISRAAERLDGDNELFTQLDALVAEMDHVATDDPEAWRRSNQQFHMLIYAAARMDRLTSMIDSLWVAVEPYLRIYVHSAPRLDEAQEDHRQILAALRRRDGARAAEVLRRHLADTETLVQQGLDAEG
jgi:DNA-binding GntR family transcriptional regulator